MQTTTATNRTSAKYAVGLAMLKNSGLWQRLQAGLTNWLNRALPAPRANTHAPQPAAQQFDTPETFSIADAPPSAAILPNTPFAWFAAQARNAAVLVFIDDATHQISKMEAMSRQQLAAFFLNPLYTSDASSWVAGRHGALQRADFDTDSTFRQQETVVANLEELLGARAYLTGRISKIDASMLDLVAIALPTSPPQGAIAMAASVNARVTLATLMTERKGLSAELADLDAHILPVLNRLGVRPPAAHAGDHSKKIIISTASGQQEGGLPFAGNDFRGKPFGCAAVSLPDRQIG